MAGGTVGGSGNNGIVMAGTMGAGVGSERRTSTGSGLSGGEDAVTVGGRDVCIILHFVVGVAFLTIVSVPVIFCVVILMSFCIRSTS